MRRDGILYVQPYAFTRANIAAQRFIVCFGTELNIPITILHSTVVITVPFSKNLLVEYFTRACEARTLGRTKLVVGINIDPEAPTPKKPNGHIELSVPPGMANAERGIYIFNRGYADIRKSTEP